MHFRCFYIQKSFAVLTYDFFFFTEIQHGLRNLLKSYNAELIKNKTAEQYLFNRDAGDRDYVLEVMLPTLLCK